MYKIHNEILGNMSNNKNILYLILYIYIYYIYIYVTQKKKKNNNNKIFNATTITYYSFLNYVTIYDILYMYSYI
ncbi:hypothetical protein PFAG_04259 [Plasmodium falciparum Santa Lucia]|nr:hypothetical protein PFBG_04288 [Plasmodium falciparum 7G8]EUT81040.1 hypothetical protein PFAG_04259 [Plasmodium falciparum Santa Lucia]